MAAFALTSVAITSHADHTWGSYHWARTTSSFNLQVIDSVSADWNTELTLTLQEWSASNVLDLQVTATDDGPKARRQCRMSAGVIRVCNQSYGYNGWLGLATIGIDPNGHIDRGTAQMNDSYSQYWTITGEKNHVMCQEVGHLFGLGHTSENGSSQGTCMDYSSDPGSQWPNQHDYDLLADIYAHLDTYNTYKGGASSSDGGGSSGCNAPKGKGCNARAVPDIPTLGVRVAGNRDEEIWVAPRSDGGLWIHHVRLAP